jgi:DNA-binding IclR family transcriptional regulator
MAQSARSGTQSIERAVLLLREIAARGSFGWRLMDIAAHCQLDRATTHRLLGALVRERLVQQQPANRRYLPGPLLFELGLSLSGHASFQTACDGPLIALARRLEGTALLCLRSGTDFVCAARAGSVPLKALTIDIGTRRPLMATVGGISMLIAMTPKERRRVMSENRRRIARFSGTRLRALEQAVQLSLRRGFGISEGIIVPGVHAYSVAIRDAENAAFASVSIVATADKLPHSAQKKVRTQLNETADTIARLARGMNCGPNGEMEPVE